LQLFLNYFQKHTLQIKYCIVYYDQQPELPDKFKENKNSGKEK